jgi:hypothetical protein
VGSLAHGWLLRVSKRLPRAVEGAQAIAGVRRCVGGCKGTGRLLRRVGGRGA